MGDETDQVAAAYDPDQPAVAQYRDLFDASGLQQVGDFGNRGTLCDCDHLACHQIPRMFPAGPDVVEELWRKLHALRKDLKPPSASFVSCDVTGPDQVTSADDAHYGAGFIYYWDSANLMSNQDAGNFTRGGGRIDGNHLAGHDLGGVHREPPDERRSA
jgi:hypothetical protein